MESLNHPSVHFIVYGSVKLFTFHNKVNTLVLYDRSFTEIYSEVNQEI